MSDDIVFRTYKLLPEGLELLVPSDVWVGHSAIDIFILVVWVILLRPPRTRGLIIRSPTAGLWFQI